MQRTRKWIVAVLIVAPLLFSAPLTARAQEEEEESSAAGAAEASGDGEAGVIYRKKTVVSFDDDTIDGDLTRPDGAYVESRKRVRHSNLIRIRENFREKILYSVSGI